MTRTLTVEGDLTALNTVVALTGQGSVAAPSLVIPTGVTRIDKILVACACDNAAAGQRSYIIRLGGAAVLRGEQTLIPASQGGRAISTADEPGTYCQGFLWENADIEVSPSEVIRIQAEYTGTGTVTARVIVTLVFA